MFACLLRIVPGPQLSYDEAMSMLNYSSTIRVNMKRRFISLYKLHSNDETVDEAIKAAEDFSKSAVYRALLHVGITSYTIYILYPYNFNCLYSIRSVP